MAILDHVSHSQINMFLRCPRQWLYRYVEGLKIPPSGPLIEGGCYHKALEANYKQKITSRADIPVSSCLDAFSDAWDTRLAEEEFIDWEDKDPGDLKDEGISLVREYQHSTAPSIQPIKVEDTYVSEVAGVKFVCIIDLEDILHVVIDHKTSKRVYLQNDVDRDLQASAAAFVLGRPIIFYNHVAVKAKVPSIQLIKTYRMQADIDWYVEMVAQIVVQMSSGVAPPRPTGWWCSPRFCGYYERCRGECARTYF